MNRSLYLLTGVVLLVVLVAALLFIKDKSLTQSAESKLLAPGLIDSANEINRIQYKEGDKSLTVIKDNSTWLLEEKGNYPANINKIRQLVLSVGESVLKDKKTSNPEKYSRLGLDDESAKRLTIHISGMDEPMTDLLIGKEAYGLGGNYIRYSGGEQTWIATGDFKVDYDLKDWIDKKLLSIKKERVNKIIISQSDGSEVIIKASAGEGKDFEIVNVPKGKASKSDYDIDGIASSLEDLTIEEVYPLSSVKIDESTKVKTIIETKDGVEFLIELFEFEGIELAVLDIKYKPELIIKRHDESSINEVEEIDSVENEVKSIKSKVSGWAFDLPYYRYSSLTKKMDNLTK